MAGKREQQMKEITERLEQGVRELFTSEMYTEYLKTMSQFHNYSFNNTLLIAMQKPDATLVAGYQAWQKKFKRQVKRGEKGIQIIAPAPIREKEEVEKFDPETNEPILRPDGQPETEEVIHTIPRFRVTTVFDVSQTYGEPLPELETPELMGSVENFEIFMQAIREVSPVPIRYDEIESGAKGYYSNANKEIVIQNGMSERQTMKTAVHEVTHAKLHDRDVMEELGEKKNQMTREVEAESVAYTVCQYFGLDTSDYSFPYIAGWSSSMEMKELRTSMDTIRKTAGEFIEDMMEQIRSLKKELSQEKNRELVNLQDGEKYQGVDFFDVPALFSNGRVDISSLPEGIYRYELQGADYDPGYPLYVKESVGVNHAGTILTAYPMEIPGQGFLRLGVGLDFSGGMQTIREYQNEMEERDRKTDLEVMESSVIRENEDILLSGDNEYYGIYQILDGTKGSEYLFMGMDFVNSHGMKVDAGDYTFVYGGKLTETDTLDSLYEKFNLYHPEGYYGHSLSVSDVVVIRKDNQVKAYYADSFGFRELPDFVRQRMHEAEMNRKREDSVITLDTTGVEIEQHEGLWHTVDKMEIENEIFYLMRHNEFGDSVAAVIVNSDGELVAQELENGFDRGAMEAIQEYFAGKGITWEPEVIEEPAEENIYPPVYPHTLTYAMEHAEADDYLDSRRLNIACKNAVEEVINYNFDGMHLANEAVEPVLKEYGQERLSYVLACTLQYKSWDGRFSRDNKAWAEGIPVEENVNRGVDVNTDYVVDSHPTVLDGFVSLARKRFTELEQETSFIAQHYVVNDAYGVKAERKYQYFADLQDALKAYHLLPNHLDKQIGMESTEQSPSRMALISCKNGMEEIEDINFNSLSGKWLNPETKAAQQSAEEYLASYDKEIAYWIESSEKYLFVQTGTQGYDYTFYDKEYRELDGGSYDDPDLTIRGALEEILADEERVSIEECEVIDCEKFLETVEKQITPTSEFSIREQSLNGQCRHDIEEKVLCFAQAQIEEMGLSEEVRLLGARVYGRCTREGLYQEKSDLDVVLSYTGNIQEDAFFNVLHESGMKIAGLPVDVNPICIEKSGTLEKFMEDAERYLDDKELQQLASDIDRFSWEYDTYEYQDSVEDREENVRQIYSDLTSGQADHIREWVAEIAVDENDDLPEDVEEAKNLLARIEQAQIKGRAEITVEPEKVDAKITFYVAECMEFPVLGEYHDNLTLQEAVELYEKIPSERMNGVKGIGFCLEDGSMYDGEYELMSGGKISRDMIDMVPYYKDHPLVQKAISDLEEILSQKKQMMEKEVMPESFQEQQVEPERTQAKALEKDGSTSKGTGKKESVLQALRERQARLKEQNQDKDKQKLKGHKKGEQEL